MKDYGFDYMNYITNLPSNMMGMDNDYNMNQMTNTDKFNKINITNNKLNNFMKNDKMNNIFKMKDKDQILEPYEGLMRGNMFANLYDPYKNYKPQELDPDNEREALLYQVMQYKFALIELNLYLDTHPNDRETVELYKKYLNIEKQMCDKYESMYGPLTTGSSNLDEGRWEWNNSPWPWEVK